MTSNALRLLAAVLLAGCVASPEDFASASVPIVGGEEGGNPAVVFLQNYRSGGLCTGTLIAERVVLTAKHCVQEPFDDGPANPSDIIVGVGESAYRPNEILRVQSIYTTPGSYTIDSRGSVGNDLIGVDVAVMVLQNGVAGIEPIPIRREDPTALTGETITAIGFGQRPDGRAGTKYTAEGRVQGVRDNLIFVGPLTCQGDSGGPAITPENEVAGVVSFGAGSCGSGYGAYNAIYSYLELIDMALTEAGSCLNDGAERCDGADNDCDEQVDEDCTPIGGACEADDECVGLTCRETPAGSICTSPCDPLRPDIGCGPGFYCAFSDGCEGYCTPIQGEAGTLPIDAECTRDEECASLFCTDPGDGRRRCLTPCRGDSGMCLAGEACVALPGECGACVQEDILVGMRGFGEGCADDEECRSGSCYDDSGRRYCSRACTGDSECPSGYHCRGDVCAAGPRGDIGDPCLGNGDCTPPTFCAMRAEQSWCTNFCDDENPCPEGFNCVSAGGAQVCAPDRGLVGDECTSDEECISGLCSAEGEEPGICTRVCGPDAPCAVGLECRRVEDGLMAVCVEPAVEVSGGGCAVSPERRGSAAWLLLAAFAVFGGIARRRRA